VDFFLSCSFGSSKVRPKKKYAAYSKEAERQHIAFGKKQAMRYFLLSILASRALSLPAVMKIQEAEEAAQLALFWLRYWLNPVLEIENIPQPDRVIEWTAALLAGSAPIQSTTLQALMELIDEHISRSESIQWLKTLSDLPEHSIPAVPTPAYSRISL
jgi:hypothetical protein